MVDRVSIVAGDRKSQIVGDRTSRVAGDRTSQIVGDRTSRLVGDRTSRIYGDRRPRSTVDRSSRNSFPGFVGVATSIAPLPPPEASPDSSPAPSIKESPPKFEPGWRFYVCFSTLLVIALAAALDATSLSVALAIISQELKTTAIEAFWAGTSFLVAATVLQPAFASFSQIFGRKPIFLIGLTLFTAGAIVAGSANGFTALLIGRVFQGIGAGGVLVLTEVIVTDLVPLRLRGNYFAMISLVWCLGSVGGPLMGGAFAQEVSWRWIFWINLPFCALGFVLIPLYLKLNYQTSSFLEKLRRIDWLGSTLFVCAILSILIPVTWGGVMYPWDHWRTLVPLCLGSAGLVGAIVYEKYVPVEPMIPLSIFNNRSAAVTYIGTVLHGMVLWCILYYIPLYYEAVKGSTPIMAGVSMMPETFTVAPASVFCGVVVTMTGRYRWAVWSGWVFTVVGMGLLTLLDVETSTVQWIFLNLVAGIGTGLLFPAMAFAIQAASTDENMAISVAMFSFFRALGQAIGVAVGGVVFQNGIRKQMLKFADIAARADEYSKDAAALVQVIKEMPKDLPARAQIIASYAKGLQDVWAVMAVFAGIGLLTSLATRGISLDRELVTDQGFKYDEEVKDDEEKR